VKIGPSKRWFSREEIGVQERILPKDKMFPGEKIRLKRI
jgi:hypothetical protein